MKGLGLFFSAVVGATATALTSRGSVKSCPGYKVSDVRESGNTIRAQLELAGKPCNTYGEDLKNLVLKVEFQTDSRLHVMIYDEDEEVYQVPEDVVPRPKSDHSFARADSAFEFSFEKDAFSFKITRKDTDEVVFDTSASDLIFQSQYLKLRTSLPDDPNLYGLGEHSDPFRLKTTNYTRTIWNRDSFGIPPGTNIYGAHPVYFDHRGEAGTHGVFLLNSNGMDVKIGDDDEGKKFLEYNTIGGVFDFYFLAGPTPKDVSKQYAETVGLPIMAPYWGFGFHQCRYGYRDIFNVAEVVYNYSKANIPLETMWTDIDYMDRRRVFTLDPERFPLEEVRALVDYLHENDQHYVVMVDPAISYTDNPAFNRGVDQDVFLKIENGSIYKGAVWPGVTAFPDWFHPDIQDYWNNEFAEFFDAETGVDIDALWIDMNEGANFCNYPCEDPEGWERDNDLPPTPPPVRENPRPLPGFPSVFQPPTGKRSVQKGSKSGLPGRELIDPPYTIKNAAGSLSNKTLNTDVIHANGLAEYDVHNLYGSMMSSASKTALVSRRPNKRPLVITRSTFAGAGVHVGHWLGDNLSSWEQYRISIYQMMAFSSMFQVPMVGSDVCGFGDNTTESLCARWAMLGAFNPFYRNHNNIDGNDQEFYLWETVAEAARNAIEIRYMLLDYFYTAFYAQTQSGDPSLKPMFFEYPEDKKAADISHQFFYGDAILVSPVVEENATSVEAYFPRDIFYDYYTGEKLVGKGKTVTIEDVPLTRIPLHIRGGTIVPLRVESAKTTTALRKKPFNILIAPDKDGKASGKLYLDDGESIEQPFTIKIDFTFENGKLTIKGEFNMALPDDVKISKITLLGAGAGPTSLSQDGAENMAFDYDSKSQKVTAKANIPLTGPAEVNFK